MLFGSSSSFLNALSDARRRKDTKRKRGRQAGKIRELEGEGGIRRIAYQEKRGGPALSFLLFYRFSRLGLVVAASPMQPRHNPPYLDHTRRQVDKPIDIRPTILPRCLYSFAGQRVCSLAPCRFGRRSSSSRVSFLYLYLYYILATGRAVCADSHRTC